MACREMAERQIAQSSDDPAETALHGSMATQRANGDGDRPGVVGDRHDAVGETVGPRWKRMSAWC